MIEPVYKSPFNKSCESTIEKIIQEVEKLEEFYLKIIVSLRNENEVLKTTAKFVISQNEILKKEKDILNNEIEILRMKNVELKKKAQKIGKSFSFV